MASLSIRYGCGGIVKVSRIVLTNISIVEGHIAQLGISAAMRATALAVVGYGYARIAR